MPTARGDVQFSPWLKRHINKYNVHIIQFIFGRYDVSSVIIHFK